jgi:hypothetical protein
MQKIDQFSHKITHEFFKSFLKKYNINKLFTDNDGCDLKLYRTQFKTKVHPILSSILYKSLLYIFHFDSFLIFSLRIVYCLSAK